MAWRPGHDDRPWYPGKDAEDDRAAPDRSDSEARRIALAYLAWLRTWYIGGRRPRSWRRDMERITEVALDGESGARDTVMPPPIDRAVVVLARRLRRIDEARRYVEALSREARAPRTARRGLVRYLRKHLRELQRRIDLHR